MTVLITQCLSIPVAASTEWIWPGSKLTVGQIFSDVLVITGICVTLFHFGALNPTHGIDYTGFYSQSPPLSGTA